ncbi:hypothetical protein [Janthinobacterium agaricidamnosum]|uniref:hypothetical protein n=1 Tax=Janthinobacterium agaricidamnosum TaxID=55508 RepID=UPI00068BD248|nr:hypothetical protein [Janthinobacterium agaricidamnosum]
MQFIAAAAVSQETVPSVVLEEAPATPQTVEVSGARDPELKPYRSMLKGVDAFNEFHRLAPHASLRFILQPARADQALEGATLQISSDKLSIPIPVHADGTFTLQRHKQAMDENADIVSNKKKNSLRWRPDIHSPNLPANVRRLGDLRLECVIRWAVEKDDLPFVTRNAFRLVGGPCHSSMVAVLFHAPRRLSAVTAVSGERRATLSLGKQKVSYIAPLHDMTWNDDTLLELTFEDHTSIAQTAGPAPQ